jgi:ribose 5-phosphate isomerase B
MTASTLIAIASDHAGYPLKQHLVTYLRATGHTVLDLGVDTPDVPADYPDGAAAVASAIQAGRAERGILVCGSGVGICIAANKHRGIYAAIAHDIYSAAQGVEHDRMNVLCLGSRVVGTAVAERLTDAFLNAQYDGHERFERRFKKMQAVEDSGGAG